MTASRFHKLLWLYVGLIVVASFSGFIQGFEASQLAHASGSLAQGPDRGGIYWALMLGLLIAFVVSLVGLFGFAPWSRPLSLTVTVLGIFGSMFFSPSVTTGLDGALSEAAATLWGAILALSYFSPVSTRFNREGAAKLGK